MVFKDYGLFLKIAGLVFISGVAFAGINQKADKTEVALLLQSVERLEMNLREANSRLRDICIATRAGC